MRVLITGITGFVGSHLAELCLSKGYEVHGIKRWRSKTENINHLDLVLKECDIRDANSVRETIEEIRPDGIFHLAAQSFVHSSWHAPSETLSTNILGEVNVLEAIRKIPHYNPKILIPGSSEEYGEVKPEEMPIKETHHLRPLSPYAVSKVAQDLLGFQYFKSYGLNIIRTRAFNHTGPRRGEVFASSTFAKQIAEIENGKEPIIYVGNLEAQRDFCDVRDVVNAYLLALEKCDAGEVYNICSGKPYKIKDILEMLLELSKVKVEVKQDPSRMRPSDVPILYGDSSKFREKTGWTQQIEFRQTLKDLLDYWREKLS